MECKEAEELIVPYLLGAIDDVERRLMESHLDVCRECTLVLQGDGETVARMAFSVPQQEVPDRVKDRLLKRIDSHEWLGRFAAGLMSHISDRIRSFGRGLVPYAGKAVALFLVIGLVSSGVWFNGRLSEISEDNAQLSNQLAQAQERESEVMAAVKTQQDMTYEAIRMSTAPGTSVNNLIGTGPWSSARGMIMTSRTSNRALLLVADLPPLPPDRVYQVWLVKDNRKYNAGWFTVDSTGYGQTVIIPVAPFWEFDAAGITIEPRGGSIDPTGVSVLKGDL